MTPALRNALIRFMYNATAVRLTMSAFALAVLLLQPTGPISGGGGV
ncbi:MAG TPA: hypothetical protein VJG32_17205 [Anaerolineae bacterium]|nr:hypothetical protein [Anaerolineae bacterium]